MPSFLKQQNRGRSIIIGIIIFAALTFLIKMISYKSPKTAGDELHEMANKINEKVPLAIDSLTTLDSVTVPGDFKLLYSYQINASAENIDTSTLINIHREWILEKFKNDPNTEFFKMNMVELQARYFDKNGQYLCFITITPYDYLIK